MRPRRVFWLQPAIWKRALMMVAALAAAAYTFPVFAQEAPDDSAPEELPTIPVVPASEEVDEDATVLDTIEVTGSHIKRTDYETASPVLVFTRAEIERSGHTSIGEFLQELPTAGSAQNRLFNKGGNGQTEIDLRNLGSKRLLVLVNGHRWIGGTDVFSTSSVNLNTIPISLVDRIEVLKDGASAIYGSEAIVGVINVITRKDFVGSELRSFVGGFSQGDTSLQQSHHLAFGSVIGGTPFFVNLGYVTQDALFAGERDLTRIPKFGTGLTRGSGFTPRTQVLFIPNSENGGILGEELCPTFFGADQSPSLIVEGEDDLMLPVPNGLQFCDMTLTYGQTITGASSETTATVAPRYEPFNRESLDPAVNDLYNYVPLNYLLTPFEQQSLFTQVSHPLGDSLGVNLQILYLTTRTERQLSEAPLLFGDIFFIPGISEIYIDATQLYNPFDQDIGRHASQVRDADVIDFAPGTGTVLRRMVEAGPRFLSRDLQTLVARAALDGSGDYWDHPLTWSLGHQYARSDLDRFQRGDFNMERVKLALGSQTTCISSPGCVPLNLFGAPGAVTREMLDYITFSTSSSAQAEITDSYLNVTTELGKLGNLLPAPIGLAFGAERREESFANEPDPFIQAGISSESPGGERATRGGIGAAEAYLEVAVPLLQDLPYIAEMDLTLAGRYVAYTEYQSKFSAKAGLRWKPFDDLLLRGTVSEAYRAPNITERDLGGVENFGFSRDPCATDFARPEREQGTAVDQNCDAEGAPEKILETFEATPVTLVGNKNLHPETATTYTAGLVWSPSYIPDFNLVVDWYHVAIDDFIDYLSADFVLDSCFRRDPGSPRPQTCDMVERDETTGYLRSVFSATYNFAFVQTSGVEVQFNYVVPVGAFFSPAREWGTFQLQFDSNYLDQYDRFLANAGGSGATKYSYAGLDIGDQPFPRFKFKTSLIWAYENWVASWTTRYIHHVEEVCNDHFFNVKSPATLRNIGLCSNPDPDISDGSDNSTNKVLHVFYHDAYAGYDVPTWNMTFSIGALNVTDQDPPVSYTASANSFSATLHRVPGIQPYLSFIKRF